jgi:hypothetical protein
VLYRCGLLLLFGLTAMKNLPASSDVDRVAPAIVGRVIDAVGHGQAWAWGLFPYPILVALNYCLDSYQLPWVLAAIFVSVVILELTIRKTTMPPTPFDAVFGSTRSAAQVAWLTVALTIVCVAAMPILVVSGQFVVHVQLNLEDWLKIGWPR